MKGERIKRRPSIDRHSSETKSSLIPFPQTPEVPNVTLSDLGSEDYMLTMH